jgi:hypothetical protein
MEMFLMALALSFLGVAASAAMFAAATHGVDAAAAPQPKALPARAAAEGRFFVADPLPVPRMGVPIEVLLLQIERHVRLEQAACESFLWAPTAQSLHCRTSSPLMN